jgi:hypothetical protein
MSWTLRDVRRDPYRPGIYVYLLGTWDARVGGLVRGVATISYNILLLPLHVIVLAIRLRGLSH